MGCGASSSAADPEMVGCWDEDEEFEEKQGARRGRRGQHSGRDADKKEDFEFNTLDGEPHFGFSGQLQEPENHPEVNSAAPTDTYKLEYVYGYRAQDSRQNLFFNAGGKPVYFTAALGVILDQDTNTQTFFGGGEVDCTAKNVASDLEAHTDDVMSIGMTLDRTKAVTGQIGAAPAIFTWDACTGEKISRMKCSRGTRGITATSVCAHGKFGVAVDLSNDHCVWVFETATGTLVFKEKGDTSKIKDVAFSKKDGSVRFCTVGTRHCYFWSAADSTEKRKGIFGGHPMTSFCAVVWDYDDVCYTGGANGKVYKWDVDSRTCQATVDAHAKGHYISALNYCDGNLYSGARDCKIVQIDPADMTVKATFDTESLPRSIDMFEGQRLVGMYCGTIKIDDKVIMRSHSDGETWGLAYHSGCGPITTGDDNKVICWDDKARCASKYIDCITTRKDKARRGGASTLARTAASQQMRAVAHNGEYIAFGHNDGTVTVRKLDCPDQPCGADGNDMLLQDSAEWIEVITFSPDGTKMAVGSHDDKIRVYDASANFCLLGTCSGHSSFITAVDWSCDGTYIRTNSGDYELLFWKMPDCTQDPDGASNTKGLDWATTTMKISWETRNIYPRGVDGTHINGVARSPDGALVATGDDYGLVSIFNYPVRPAANPRCFRGHSEHVVRVCFNEDGSKLFSIGGYDQTLMQFAKC